MNHVEQTVHLDNDDAVALGVTLGLDVVDAVGYLLAFGEVVVGTIGIGDRHEIRESLKLRSVHLLFVYVDLCIGETLQFASVVSMLVGNQNLCHLLRLVAEVLQGIHIATDVLAGETQ